MDTRSGCGRVRSSRDGGDDAFAQSNSRTACCEVVSHNDRRRSVQPTMGSDRRPSFTDADADATRLSRLHCTALRDTLALCDPIADASFVLMRTHRHLHPLVCPLTLKWRIHSGPVCCCRLLSLFVIWFGLPTTLFLFCVFDCLLVLVVVRRVVTCAICICVCARARSSSFVCPLPAPLLLLPLAARCGAAFGPPRGLDVGGDHHHSHTHSHTLTHTMSSSETNGWSTNAIHPRAARRGVEWSHTEQTSLDQTVPVTATVRWTHASFASLFDQAATVTWRRTRRAS